MAPKRIRKWYSQKCCSKEEKGQIRRKRQAGAGTKILDEGMAVPLFDWIIEMRENNNRATRSMIQGKAETFQQCKDFKPAEGGCSDSQIHEVSCMTLPTT